MASRKYNQIFDQLGLHLPEILLPREGTDLTRWSVVACDQYTSQTDYWEEVERIVGDSPSTLNLIYPEVYLGESNSQLRMDKINAAMRQYIDDGTLVSQKPGFIYIDRKTSHVASRKGLIAALDLEKYDYSMGSQSLIRATEGTVLDRLPPRVRIRKNALIELPHIMVLIDDPGKTVIEPVAAKAQTLEKLYDFELMKGGGHIKGYRVDDEASISGIAQALEKLADPDLFRTKYGVGGDKGILLFAVGDGNHSLAAAKAFWEELKKELTPSEAARHPSRYALVEIVNIHDEGLVFEPIHRVLFNVEPQTLLDSMSEFYKNRGCRTLCRTYSSKDEMLSEVRKSSCVQSAHTIYFTSGSISGSIEVCTPRCNLAVGTLQVFLDEYMKSDKSIKIDYIHGEDTVSILGSQPGNMGLYLPPMDKHQLFRTVMVDGVLPRKTFSMGEADEKRFYLECRRIVKDR